MIDRKANHSLVPEFQGEQKTTKLFTAVFEGSLSRFCYNRTNLFRKFTHPDVACKRSIRATSMWSVCSDSSEARSRVREGCACLFLCVLHIKQFFLPVDIQHNQCPCRISNPRRILEEIQVLWSPKLLHGRPGGWRILLVFESWVRAPGGSDIWLYLQK